MYGDLDISILDELPGQKTSIKNCVVDQSFRPKAYAFIEHQVEQGRQAYIICPMVEEKRRAGCGKCPGLYKNASKYAAAKYTGSDAARKNESGGKEPDHGGVRLRENPGSGFHYRYGGWR